MEKSGPKPALSVFPGPFGSEREVHTKVGAAVFVDTVRIKQTCLDASATAEIASYAHTEGLAFDLGFVVEGPDLTA